MPIFQSKQMFTNFIYKKQNMAMTSMRMSRKWGHTILQTLFPYIIYKNRTISTIKDTDMFFLPFKDLYLLIAQLYVEN